MYIYQIMSNNFGYIDIILLGMIAGFIILRLRNILGRKTGHEPKIYPNFTEKKFSQYYATVVGNSEIVTTVPPAGGIIGPLPPDISR